MARALLSLVAATGAGLGTLLTIFANPAVSQSDSIYRLKKGTRLSLVTEVELSSTVASVNDTFLAKVTRPVKVRDTVIVPADTVVEGRVVRVERPERLGREGRIEVVFESIMLSGVKVPIDGVIATRLPTGSRSGFRTLSVLGGIAAGTAVGAATSAKGALIGAGIGGAVGTGIAILAKGSEFRLRKGDEFEIELRRDVSLPVLDY